MPRKPFVKSDQHYYHVRARCINREWFGIPLQDVGRINHIFGSRYFRTIIDSERYFRHAYKYIYRNPVKAELSENVETYPFSTLSGIIGDKK